MSNTVALPIPHEVLEELAERIADVVVERMEEKLRPPDGGWMRTAEAAEYLGWSTRTLHARVAENAIPYYRVDRRLLFKRSDLEAWLEEHRRGPERARTVQSASSVARRASVALRVRNEKPRRQKRERPLPPPLSYSDEDKERVARELEITRAELDEMSPGKFKKAWDRRNQRLRDAGVFARLDELHEKYGEEVWTLPISELIRAARELG